MKRKAQRLFSIVFLVSSLLHVGCTTSGKHDIDPVLSEKSFDELLLIYKDRSSELVEQANDTNVQLEQIQKNAKELMNLSKAILSSYLAKFPECETYLKKVMDDADIMLEMDVKALEKNYHRDEALPKAPENCYHVKDLLVHPATAAISTDRRVIAAEIREVLAHIEIVTIQM